MTSERFRVPGARLNLAQAFLFDRIEEGRGARRALVVDHPETGAQTYTYDDVAAMAARYGNELRSRGIGLEDRVFIILEDNAEWVFGFFGALSVGATVMFLNPRVSDEEIAFYLADSRARGVITSDSVAARLPSERPYLRTVLNVDADADR